jgi:hypothetical protein
MSSTQADVSAGPALSQLFARYVHRVDWMVCRKCRRAQEVSWRDHRFPHASGCKNADAEPHPWNRMVEIVTAGRKAAVPPVFECSAVPSGTAHFVDPITGKLLGRITGLEAA